MVGLQETGGTAAQELAEALGWHHHRAGENLGVISRHPITARFGDPDVGFYGAAGVRIAVAGGREIDLWTCHLDYTPYGPYESAFDGLPAAELIAHEDVRLAQMRDTLDRIADAAEDAVPVVLVGDFNSPSHLDWPDVEWPVTKAAADAGLRDSYLGGPPGPGRGPRPHLVADPPAARGRQRTPRTPGPHRLRPAPGPDRARLPHVRHRHAQPLAGCVVELLAVGPRGRPHGVCGAQLVGPVRDSRRTTRGRGRSGARPGPGAGSPSAWWNPPARRDRCPTRASSTHFSGAGSSVASSRNRRASFASSAASMTGSVSVHSWEAYPPMCSGPSTTMSPYISCHASASSQARGWPGSVTVSPSCSGDGAGKWCGRETSGASRSSSCGNCS
ncbi:endonuclease/exonuclease/phosphatase family protein [Streptomyces sp. L7]